MNRSILRLICITAFAFSFGSALPARSDAQVAVGVSVNFPPPDLPVYEQPPCPGDDYIWNPGYWAWDDDGGDYYWVPGTWVQAPEPDYYWTPGYWGWNGSGYIFTPGYWGPVVGFYGGVNYGFGYFGHGYQGGRWDRGHFFYNREVNNVNVNVIHNTYNTTIENRNITVNRVSYNGGNGGINVRATPAEEAAARQRHIGPVAVQSQHIQEARAERQLHANQNQGKPPIAATQRPAGFRGDGIVPAREAGALHGNGTPAGNAGPARPENRPPNRNVATPPPNTTPQTANNGGRPNYSHAREIPARPAPAAPNTGNPRLDQRYQQQQQQLAARQAQEQQKLQQKQEQEHQRFQQQQADAAKQQQMEQRHQRQTQQLVQRHEQQAQRLQQTQQPPPPRQQPHKP